MSNRTAVWRLIGAVGIVGMLLVIAVVALPSSARPLAAPRCFAETGQCIDGRFRTYWEQNGGLAVFGFPITPQRDERNRDTGRVYQTQWFERNRFELHPENAAPYDVLLGRLGDDRLVQQNRDWQAAPRDAGPQTGCLWFAETGRNVCDQASGAGFMTYWRTHGLQDTRLDVHRRSLALLGLPLTGMATETNSSGDRVQTQWFERGRLEWHPNNPREFRVLLGLLGNELLRPGSQPTAAATREPAPAATPTRTPAPPSALKRRDAPRVGVAAAGNLAFVAIFCDETTTLAAGSNLDKGVHFIAERLVVCFDNATFVPGTPISVEFKQGENVVESREIVAVDQGGGTSQFRWVPRTGYPFGPWVMTARQGAATATLRFEMRQYETLGESGRILVVDVNNRRGNPVQFVLGGFAPGVPVPIYLYGAPACPAGQDPAVGDACFMAELPPAIPDARGEATYSLPTQADDPPGQYFVSTGANPNGGFAAFVVEE